LFTPEFFRGTKELAVRQTAPNPHYTWASNPQARVFAYSLFIFNPGILQIIMNKILWA
jgi:hypothetical protein